jgi:hypothetical protein
MGPLGFGYRPRVTADENVPVPGSPLVESSCLTSCRRHSMLSRMLFVTIACRGQLHDAR